MNCPTREVLEPANKISLALPIALISDSHDSDAPKHRTDHDRQDSLSCLHRRIVDDIVNDTSEQILECCTKESVRSCRRSIDLDLPPERPRRRWAVRPKSCAIKVKEAVWKVARYIGPGLLIAVAYMDPGMCGWSFLISKSLRVLGRK